ncbi:MAG: ParB/RepB/Spo0J family partition protein [Proteobacteria bacterium]|nr:ParB/RepB/Spo0J family partition protein [Pseudomonadota bacterium]MDA1323159.1 ParB/RepB/Spo0J family partition protein [Pseudomonadota bacterium]
MTDQKPQGRELGRGLSALLGDERVKKPETIPADQRGLSLPVEFLAPSRYQPRRIFNQDDITELTASVRERGVLQPILVRPSPNKPGYYEIVAGERRWRAAQAAQLHEVPVIVRDLSDEGVLEIALVENIQRADLNPLEEASGYLRLIEEFDHTQESLSRVVGKSRSHVANTLRLLTLPESVQRLVDQGKLSAGHARALIGAEDPAGLAAKIAKSGLNVRQTEALVKREKSPRQSAVSTAPRHDPDTTALERTISDVLGLKVTIEFRGEKAGGKVVVHYSNLDQLDEIIKRLGQMQHL